jgi:hypothetical protein
MQPGEVRTPIGIAGHNLAVEHRCLGRQLVQQFRNGGEASPATWHFRQIAARPTTLRVLCADPTVN